MKNRPPTFGTMYGFGSPPQAPAASHDPAGPVTTSDIPYHTPKAPAYVNTTALYTSAPYGQRTPTTIATNMNEVSQSYENNSFWSDTQSHHGIPEGEQEARMSDAAAFRTVPMPTEDEDEASPYSPIRRHKSVEPFQADSYSTFRPNSQTDELVDGFPAPPSQAVINASRHQTMSSGAGTPVRSSFPKSDTGSTRDSIPATRLPNDIVLHDGLSPPKGEFPETPTSTRISHGVTPIQPSTQQAEENPFNHPADRRLSVRTVQSSVNTHEPGTAGHTTPVGQPLEGPPRSPVAPSLKAPTIEMTFPDSDLSFMNMIDTPAAQRQSFQSTNKTTTANANKHQSVYGDEADAYGGI